MSETANIEVNGNLTIWDLLAKDSAERENKQAVLTCKQNNREENSRVLPKDEQVDLLEKICDRENMQVACYRVIANKDELLK